MTVRVRHRRRAVHAEAIAPWVALSFILLLWWTGAQMHRRWSFGSADVIEPKKLSKPLDAPATAGPSRPSAGETTMSAAPRIATGDFVDLRSRNLLIPVEGIPATALVSSFNDARGAARKHEAIDILAPRGTRVFAVEDGKIAKLFTSDAGGLTIYEFDPSDRFVYYYAHLDRYVSGLKEGENVRRGDVIGYVGTTGNAPENTPHLHFAISKLDADHRWWGGMAVDPYLVWQ